MVHIDYRSGQGWLIATITICTCYSHSSLDQHAHPAHSFQADCSLSYPCACVYIIVGKGIENRSTLRVHGVFRRLYHLDNIDCLQFHLFRSLRPIPTYVQCNYCTSRCRCAGSHTSPHVKPHPVIMNDELMYSSTYLYYNIYCYLSNV